MNGMSAADFRNLPRAARTDVLLRAIHRALEGCGYTSRGPAPRIPRGQPVRSMGERRPELRHFVQSEPRAMDRLPAHIRSHSHAFTFGSLAR